MNYVDYVERILRDAAADPDALMATCDELGIAPHAGPVHALQ